MSNLPALMKDGINLLTRPRVHFQLNPELEEGSGHHKSAPITVPETPTTTSQVSSREQLLAELLKDLSGSKFPQVASALLPQLGYRDTTRRRRKKPPTTGGKRKYAESSDDSDSSWSTSSLSFSSGSWETPDLQISSLSSEEEGASSAVTTRLAPLPRGTAPKYLGPPC